MEELVEQIQVVTVITLVVGAMVGGGLVLVGLMIGLSVRPGASTKDHPAPVPATAAPTGRTPPAVWVPARKKKVTETDDPVFQGS